ncbi:hypothetical protein ACFYY1_34845 [Streptomyces sp. NPDC001890]|uniref:hypothetical protein n=1 Tax=Streptomyces sp. NPDC001890 TaxID=3364620 RepID=UPI0036CC55E3
MEKAISTSGESVLSALLGDAEAVATLVDLNVDAAGEQWAVRVNPTLSCVGA